MEVNWYVLVETDEGSCQSEVIVGGSGGICEPRGNVEKKIWRRLRMETKQSQPVTLQSVPISTAL